MRYRFTLFALAGRLLIIGVLLIGAPNALGTKGQMERQPRRGGVFLDPFENTPARVQRTTTTDGAPILFDESVRSGLFVDPSSATVFLDPTVPATARAPLARGGWFFEPAARASAPVLLDEADEMAALGAPQPAGPTIAEKVRERVYGGFAVASRMLGSLTSRAEVIRVADDDTVSTVRPAPTRPPATRPTAAAGRATPRIPELPTPRGSAPAAYRLTPFFETQVCGLQNGANAVLDEGILERRALSAVAGVEYALVKNGATLHLLLARNGVSLEDFVGRCVGVLGVPLQAGACGASVLEVSKVSARE